MQWKRPELWEKKERILHHENEPSQVPIGWKMFCQNSHSFPSSVLPISGSSGLFIYPKLKPTLKGCCFQSITEIQVVAQLTYITLKESRDHLNRRKNGGTSE